MNSQLGIELVRLRKKNGLSQQNLADLAGVDRLTIQKIENGATVHPQGRTLRRLANSLDVDVDWLNDRCNISGSNPSQTRVSFGEAVESWNSEKFRSQTIYRISERLHNDDAEVTHFVNFFDILDKTEWLGEPTLIQTTTLEYSTVWTIQETFIPYEAWLVHYHRAGLDLHRFFIIDPGKLSDPAYEIAVRTVLTRHLMLGLAPRVLMRPDARALNREIGASCDAIVVFDQIRSWLIGYQEFDKPFILETSNRNFSINASNKFSALWRQGRDANSLLERLHQFSKSELEQIEQDADLVNLTCDFYLRRNTAK